MDLRLRLGLSAWEERDFGVPSIQTWEETRVWREVKMPDSYLRPGSERNLYFWFKLPGKKPFPGSRPLWTRRLHADWPWQEFMAWQTNNQPGPGSSITLSPWHGVGDTGPHLGLSFWFRTCHGSCTKLQRGARIQGFLATGLAPVAKSVNLISERLRKARKATGWLRG